MASTHEPFPGGCVKPRLDVQACWRWIWSNACNDPAPWVVSGVHVQCFMGRCAEIDTWVAGKNGMRLMRDYKSGQILARATSTRVVMNQTTRRLSKMPNDVREEITPFYLPSPRHGDLDMNHEQRKIHRMDAGDHDISSLTMEYRRECGQNDVVESMTWVQHADCLIADDDLETKRVNFGGSDEETLPSFEF
ncbi:hypothetical protein SELMODRAFT_406992 [Selaginella moellendorffii]|uniref:Acyl-[acyl-carrier-protein] hydrolase n=1 Tax=Selaginella moellendorffii TaxID=88036 RepID=D8R3K3_SELML|nr:hypothetical protein SELMODRAFT_406992 [Selaginella moellendorffii]